MKVPLISEFGNIGIETLVKSSYVGPHGFLLGCRCYPWGDSNARRAV